LRRAKRSAVEQLAGVRAFATMTMWGRPFFRDVFFAPMNRTDPTGRRIREAFRRMQLLSVKPGLDELPIIKFWRTAMDLYGKPWMGPRGKEAIARIVGTEPRLMERFATEDEIARAKRMSFAELAEETLAAKYRD
jgi:hypothetical protein